MVADGRLLEAEHRLEVTDADRLTPCLQEPVEDPHAVAVGERLEHALEPVGVRVGERRLAEWRAALHKREFDHVTEGIEKT